MLRDFFIGPDTFAEHDAADLDMHPELLGMIGPQCGHGYIPWYAEAVPLRHLQHQAFVVDMAPVLDKFGDAAEKKPFQENAGWPVATIEKNRAQNRLKGVREDR